MGNLDTVLKAEIARLARREIKAATNPLRKANAGYRRDIASLKREVAELHVHRAVATERRLDDDEPLSVRREHRVQPTRELLLVEAREHLGHVARHHEQ